MKSNAIWSTMVWLPWYAIFIVACNAKSQLPERHDPIDELVIIGRYRSASRAFDVVRDEKRHVTCYVAGSGGSGQALNCFRDVETK